MNDNAIKCHSAPGQAGPVRKERAPGKATMGQHRRDGHCFSLFFIFNYLYSAGKSVTGGSELLAE